jgi:membrane protease YdiL (CAAX protease family)
LVPKSRIDGFMGLAKIIMDCHRNSGSLVLALSLITAGVDSMGWRLHSEEYIFIKLGEISRLVLFVAISILLIFEEWIFRGILLKEIAYRSNSKFVGIIFSSLIFALFHLSNQGTYPAFALPLVGAGLLLRICYSFGGLAGATMAHRIYNSISTIP